MLPAVCDKLPLTEKGLKLLQFKVMPLLTTLYPDASDSPLKPVNAEVAPNVKVPPIAPAIVKVPLPLKVPLTVRLEPLEVPGWTVGLAPRGRLQSLPTVVVCDDDVLVITTRLRVALLQARL